MTKTTCAGSMSFSFLGHNLHEGTNEFGTCCRICLQTKKIGENYMQRIVLKNIEEFKALFEDFVDGKRRGVIRLAVPAANINEWYGKNISPLTEATGLTEDEIEQVMYYDKYLINGKLYSKDEYADFKEKHPEWVPSAPLMGAAALEALIRESGSKRIMEKQEHLRKHEKELMAKLDSICAAADKKCFEQEENEEESKEIIGLRKRQMDTAHELKDVRDSMDACKQYCAGAMARLFISEINIFPAQLRTIIYSQAKRAPYMVMHDIYALYIKILMRNARVVKLTELKAPEVILCNEKRMLQEAVDNLIRNGLRGKTSRKGNGEPLASVSDVVLMNTNLV